MDAFERIERKPHSYELSDPEKWDEENRFGSFQRVDPANMDVYDPRESQRIPKEGAWAMIVRKLPGLEGAVDQHIRVARCFFLEHEGDADDAGFTPSGMYRVNLNSPWGTVKLYPYEYAKIEVETLLTLWQQGELVFHPTNMEPGRLNDQVFYARSRGIGLADAMVMALGTVKGNIGWFEPALDLAAACEEMEDRVHRWKTTRKSTERMEIVLHMGNEKAKGGVG
jgi:hypothetical protein